METVMLENQKVLIYSKIQAMKREQERLIAEGKMEKPKWVYDVFTPE